ncbi:thymidine phosphorylase family protein [Chitinivorax sp. PXF-14]|uniref:thymidine phosphorylase family protein n=1 Tax=Chitinivorax sp. PXF-14 TaxID=3230488 RepID=UPI003466E6EA
MLVAKRIGIDTYTQPVVYLRADSHICRSEGFASQSGVLVECRGRTAIATLNVITGTDLVETDEAGLSEAAWRLLQPNDGECVRLAHAPMVESLSYVRAKVYGQHLSGEQMRTIIHDVVSGRYSDLQLSAFVTACAGNRMSFSETVDLTRAMVEVGDRLSWGQPFVADKHCVGGLPGNRTTPIVVAVVTANGILMPKTSSRAITSPAGTADVIETLAPVDLDVRAMRRVVEREGGCMIWGGAVRLSPADDILIRVERPLDLDSEGQVVASILSKKVSAGSTHVLIDIPVGPTAKVRSNDAATQLAKRLIRVGNEVGLHVHIKYTDGGQPVGRGIGPALEARDVLAVLQGSANAPADLRERALLLAGELLELAGRAPHGQGLELARSTLDSGQAWRKFQAICEAQGGLRTPGVARYVYMVTSLHSGRVVRIDNRQLARVAKLAGAPNAPAAGIEFLAPLGSWIERGQPLFAIHAEAPGELTYARAYLEAHPDIVTFEDTPSGEAP